MLRFLIFCLAFLPATASLPPDLAGVCRSFQSQNPKGWSFTQTTTAAGRTLVEHYDAAQPEFNRWTLRAEDGQTPDVEQARKYREKFTRRSRGGNAPGIASQLDLGSAELVGDRPDRVTYRFRLKAGESDDKTANFLRAIVTFHKPSQTIEIFELKNITPFSPVFGVKISELHTAMHYHLPADGRPGLLAKITTRTRGRAFFRSLDADMLVTYGDYAWAGKMPPFPPRSGP